MKYLSIFLLFLTSCAHTPMLEEGSCYKATLDNIPGLVIEHDLTAFKVVRVSEYFGNNCYVLDFLDNFGDKIYSTSYNYAYVPVDRLDKYVAPLLHQFIFDNPEEHAIQCNPIKEEPKSKSPPSITERDKP